MFEGMMAWRVRYGDAINYVSETLNNGMQLG